MYTTATGELLPGAQYVAKWNWGAWGLYPFWLMNRETLASVSQPLS